MEPRNKYDTGISTFIDCVQKELQISAVNYCADAMHNFKEICKKINVDHSRKIGPVYKLIDDVAHLRVLKKEEKDEAVSLFNRYIKPFLQEEEREKATYPESKCEPHTDTSRSERVSTSNERTKKPLERGTQGLVNAFRSVYVDGAWNDAFKDLQTKTNSERLSIECLLRIVQKAFEVNRREAEQQLSTAEECAKQIVRTGKLISGDYPKSSVKKTANELLFGYRYLHADLATERLQKVILEEVKKLIFHDYNITFNEETSVGMFTRECAEITWLMCVEDPPINIIHEDYSERIDRNNYEIVRGKPYRAIVWPALQQSGYRNALAPGVLWSQE